MKELKSNMDNLSSEERKWAVENTDMWNWYATIKEYWISFRTEWGINNHYIRERKYFGTITAEDAFAMDRNVTVNSWNTNNFISLNKSIGVHKLSGLIGQQASGQQE